MRIVQAVPTLEGAGVHLKRVFGHSSLPQFDPFLLLDDFHGNDPKKYIKGFPWHPHRGIETITYLIYGKVEHGDSLGNAGVIEPGDVQWMTAGSGIIHQEMPKGRKDGLMRGLQLWANLPASQKMTEPAYRDVHSSQIPEVSSPGVRVKIVAGTYGNTTGPVQGIFIQPQLFDVNLAAGGAFIHEVPEGYTYFAYILDGSVTVDGGEKEVSEEHLVSLKSGKPVTLTGGKRGAKIFAAAGKPLNEPVAWGGPIVMNTKDELRQAFLDYEQGTFLRHVNRQQDPS